MLGERAVAGSDRGDFSRQHVERAETRRLSVAIDDVAGADADADGSARRGRKTR